jgi:hypothetical protein
MQQLLTTRQAAQVLGMTEAFLERARWSGEPPIPFIKVSSRAIRYDPADLQSYLRSRVRTSTSEQTGGET